MPLPEPRAYSSPKRDAAAAQTRQKVLDTAVRLLDEGPALMSMEAVAKAAGVTRLTVYKQFGSRRGLLEAVFDENGRRGGIRRIAEAMQNPNGAQGILAAIDILCEFWGAHPGFGKLHDAAAVDPDFAEAINQRNERRRTVLITLLDRIDGPPDAKKDAADLLFGLTTMQMFRSLLPGRTPADVAAMLKRSAGAILDAYKLT